MRADRGGRLPKVRWLPLLRKLFTMEAGIVQNRAALASYYLKHDSGLA